MKHIEINCNSLPEEKPSEDLEKTVEKYLDELFGKGKHQPFYKELFIAGFERGKEAMKKQMMKDAVEVITVQRSLTEPEFVKQRVIFLKEG